MAEKTIAETIADAGRDGIAEVTVDGTTTKMMSVDDRIKAEEHRKKSTGTAKNHLGMHFRQLRPGGTG